MAWLLSMLKLGLGVSSSQLRGWSQCTSALTDHLPLLTDHLVRNCSECSWSCGVESPIKRKNPYGLVWGGGSACDLHWNALCSFELIETVWEICGRQWMNPAAAIINALKWQRHVQHPRSQLWVVPDFGTLDWEAKCSTTACLSPRVSKDQCWKQAATNQQIQKKDG